MKKIALLLGALAISGAVLADCCDSGLFRPYVGADAQVKRGARILGSKATLPQANIYIGSKFGDFFGAEFGSYLSKAAKGNGRKLKSHGLHASLLAFLPICPVYNLELFTGLGLAHLRSTIHSLEAINKSSLNVKESVHKMVPRVMVGLNLGIVEGLKLRPSLVWENSKRLKSPSLDIKNNLHYGVGFNYQF